MTKGRPRSQRPREPNGRASRRARDHGTPEAQAKRLLLVPDGDQAQASCPLDVLHAASVISHDQHRAGLRYAWLHAIVFGRAHHRGACRYQAIAADGPDQLDGDDWLERRSAELDAALKALAHKPGNPKGILDDIAVFERLPAWAGPCLPTYSHVTEGKRLLAALDLVAAHMAGRKAVQHAA